MGYGTLMGMDNVATIQDAIRGNPTTEWSVVAGTFTHLPTGGVAGGGAFELANSSARLNAQVGITTGVRGVFAHYRWPGTVTATNIFSQHTTATAAWNDSATSHDRILVNADGSVTFFAAGLLRDILFPVGTIQPDVWYYICAVIDRPSTTSARPRCRVNNITAVGTSTSVLNNIRFPRLHGASGGTLIMDDIVYVTHDASVDAPQRIYTLRPVADRPTQDFAIIGGSNAFDAVDDLPPNDAVDYIASGTVGAIAEFDLSDLPGGVTSVSALRVGYRAQREATGGTVNVTMRAHAAGGGVIATHTGSLVNDSWESFAPSSNLTTNPLTAQPFTTSELDGMYVAIEVTV